MKRLVEWIQKRPLIAFFLITFAITWGLGFSYNAVMNQNKIALILLASIATCGPAFAAIIVSAVSKQEPKVGTNKPQVIAFFVALILGTAVFVANNILLDGAPFSLAMAGLVLILMTPPVAFVISAAYSRLPAVRETFASLVKLRGAAGWSLAALVFVPGLALLASFVGDLLGKPPAISASDRVAGLPLVGLITVKFLYQLFFFNATGEEIGWSGFVRPRLQARVSPLATALILAAFWAPWHAFVWYAEGQPVFTWEYWVDAYINVIPASIVIGWFYNRSKGSILVAGIAHAASNTAFAFLPNLDWGVFNGIVFVAAIALVLLDRMWKRLPSENPAVYTSASPTAVPQAVLSRA
jgi:membrane protease YdiL (CAAX protease family)